MKLRMSAVALAAAGALGMALAPSAAVAHSGSHPFENCTAAYDAGYSEIPRGDEHYGKHLDRDGDGIGCDQPPSDFVPAKDRGKGEEAGSGGQDGGALADTGGSSATPYLATGGGLALAAGAGVLLVTRKRRLGR